MNKATEKGWIDSSSATIFRSQAFSVFFDKIPNFSDGGRVLDLGPVCNENINLFARRVKKLYVFDGFAQVVEAKRGKRTKAIWWRQLDYPAEIFDGIILWDLVDRLTNEELRELISRCGVMLKPGGVALAYANGNRENNRVVNTFVLDEDFQVTFRSQSHLELPIYARKNRDMLESLNPLKLVQSFIFRTGLREFLLRKS